MRTILQSTRNIDHIRFNLTLVRHAETHANADGIIQGLIDTELSTIGYLQSQALGRHLQYHRFTNIYSSDLKRAAETARQIRSLNRVTSCDIQYDILLRERMYGIAQGRTRQWLRELAKENGVPYVNFTPSGAETSAQVRERAVSFFQQLCHELLQKYGANSSTPSSIRASFPKQNDCQPLSRSVSSENLSPSLQSIPKSTRKRSLSTGDYQSELSSDVPLTRSHYSSTDSALDLSSISSDQQSIASSTSIISRNSSFEKHRMLWRGSPRSPYENDFSNLDVLMVSHGAVIRELIKYFACDLQTDIGKHLDTIQDIAPNTSITRFEVTYSMNNELIPTTSLKLIDYHQKIHLMNTINDEYNLDVVNKCNL
ncbi:hypothetical protein I4U23_006808 [Adineta vaga]|nr:hypothetical protein I4U23_006808 [Adineta vaga]